ncbi:MAG: diguanylate cyclase domain-containing protein [Actinomycetota bacterium]
MPSATQLMDVIAIQTDIAKLGLDLGAVMALVVERTLALIGADGAAIELAEADDMVYRAAAGSAATQIGLRLKRESSLSGLCVRTGDILRCDDSETDARVDREACRRVGLRSMIVMPLLHNGATVGALKAMSTRPGRFGEADMRLLGLLSEMVGAAMFYAAKYDTDELFRRATHDGMTGLANRSLFMDRLRTAVACQGRNHKPAGVLMIDMDGLKSINDNHGHRAGDAVIREFACRLSSVARSSDTVARLGGDEFAVLLTPVDVPQGVSTAVTRLTERLTDPFSFEGRAFQLKASVGVAHFPEDGCDITDLIEIADQRMYTVKRGRQGTRSVVG